MRECRAGLPGDQEIAFELAERITGEQRVGAQTDHLGVVAQRVGTRNPGHRAVEHRDHVGLAEMGGGIEAEAHGVIGRQADVAGFRLHHRQREFIGERSERRHRFRRAPGRGGQDQRELRLGDERGGFLDRGA